MTPPTPLTAEPHVYRHHLEFEVEGQLLDRYAGAGRTVLDVGTGATGRSALLAQDTGADVCSIELNSIAADEFATTHPGHGVGLARADMTAVPFARASFDVVFVALHGLDYLLTGSDRRAALAEFERVLVPGGVLVFNGFNPVALLVSPSGLRGRGAVSARLRYAITGRAFRRTLIDVNGLELRQAPPPSITREVEAVTSLRRELLTNLSGTRTRPWLVTLLTTAPYYVFRKPGRQR